MWFADHSDRSSYWREVAGESLGVFPLSQAIGEADLRPAFSGCFVVSE